MERTEAFTACVALLAASALLAFWSFTACESETKSAARSLERDQACIRSGGAVVDGNCLRCPK